MDEATGTPSDLTWDDVIAVCKLMDVACGESGFGDGTYVIVKKWAEWGTTFSDPAAALEFISAPEHKLETKYANILGTQL